MDEYLNEEHGEWRLEETKRLARVLKVAGMVTSQPRRWKRADLARLFEVGTRAIDRDLEMLRGLGYEITRAPGGGYAFARTPALPPVTLSMHEVLVLKLADALRSRRSSAPARGGHGPPRASMRDQRGCAS